MTLDEIPGFLFQAEGAKLQELAESWPGEGAVVEIGSFKGKSTCCLAVGCKRADRGKVFAIDHFRGSPEHAADPDILAGGSTLLAFRRHLAALDIADCVIPVVSESLHAAGLWFAPIRVLFIDAEHAYGAVKADYEAFAPHVIEGGAIAFHDYGSGWVGVTQLVDELLASAAVEKVSLTNSLMVVRKT